VDNVFLQQIAGFVMQWLPKYVLS